MRPRVDVIVVNWNAGLQLLDCVNSFAEVLDEGVDWHLTVVDNASSDGSADPLAGLSGPIPIKIIRNTQNRGFAAACNQGAAGSTADFLLFLNPDTELKPGSLKKPADFLADPANSNVGIVGIQLVDAAGSVARTCARRPTVRSLIGQSLGLDRLMPSLFPSHFLRDWPHDQTREVDQVIGAFFFVRRALYGALGGFDERFFVYFEDLDFSLRARTLGFRSVYLASAQAFHRGQGTTDAARDRRLFYSGRSRILFCRKHFTRPQAFAVTLVTLAIEPLTRTMALMLGGRLGEIPDIFRGFGMLWADRLGITGPQPPAQPH